MKTKYTKKTINNWGLPVIGLGYCEAQTLFPASDAYGYSNGIYGWSCDYHMIYNPTVIISTGYRPTGLYVDHKTVSEYEDRAKELYKSLPYDDFVIARNKLQKEFVNTVLEGKDNE